MASGELIYPATNIFRSKSSVQTDVIRSQSNYTKSWKQNTEYLRSLVNKLSFLGSLLCY